MRVVWILKLLRLLHKIHLVIPEILHFAFFAQGCPDLALDGPPGAYVPQAVPAQSQPMHAVEF